MLSLPSYQWSVPQGAHSPKTLYYIIFFYGFRCEKWCILLLALYIRPPHAFLDENDRRHHHTVQVTMHAFSICTITLEKHHHHHHTVQVTISQPPPHVPVEYLRQLVIEKDHQCKLQWPPPHVPVEYLRQLVIEKDRQCKLQWSQASTRTIRTTTCARK